MSMPSGIARSMACGSRSRRKARVASHHGAFRAATTSTTRERGSSPWVSSLSRDRKHDGKSSWPLRTHSPEFVTGLSLRSFSTGSANQMTEGAAAPGFRFQTGLGVHTLRFIHNSISDRWFVIHKPPGWTLRHSSADRPSVENVLQPLLEAATARKALSLVESGSPGAEDVDARKKTRISKDMLKAMEEELEDQQTMKGLYFPMQLDADAQGLLVVATDQAMDRQLSKKSFRALSLRPLRVHV